MIADELKKKIADTKKIKNKSPIPNFFLIRIADNFFFHKITYIISLFLLVILFIYLIYTVLTKIFPHFI